jgi:outer membrane protein assembly factor BamB
VAGNVVLLIDTPEQAYLAAWNARTGKQAWKAERPIGWLGSYTTPVVYKPGSGPEQVIVAGAVELTGYQATTGERIWWSRGVTYGPAISPLLVGDMVYTLEPATGGEAQPFAPMLAQTDKNKNGKVEIAEETAGETAGASIYRRLFTSIDKHSGNGDGVLAEEEWAASFNPKEPAGGFVRVALGGKGDLGAGAVQWRYKRGLPYVTAPLLYQGVLYVVRNGGILATFEPESGKLLDEQRLKGAIDDYYAQPVAGDGKVYFASKEGKVSVIRAGGKWELVSSGDFGEQVIATPAIADGRIYLRAAGTLYCFATPN